MSLLVQLPAVQTPPLARYSVSVTLDGTTYTLRLSWNEADAGWYVVLLDEPGQVVLAGAVRLVADWPLWRGWSTRTPPGYLMVRDTSGAGRDPGIDELGTGARCVLVYLTAAEAAALGS